MATDKLKYCSKCGACNTEVKFHKGMCRPCKNKSNLAYKKKNIEKSNAYQKKHNEKSETKLRYKKWADENREHVNKQSRERNAPKRKELNARTRELRARDNNKSHNESNKAYKKANPHIINEQKMRRAVKKKQGSLDLGLNKEIQEIYKTCSDIQAATGIKHNVDHIIPVLNKDVCGLHVPWNLQILPQLQNIKKTNKFDFTVENESWKQDLEEEVA